MNLKMTQMIARMTASTSIMRMNTQMPVTERVPDTFEFPVSVVIGSSGSFVSVSTEFSETVASAAVLSSFPAESLAFVCAPNNCGMLKKEHAHMMRIVFFFE